MEESKEFIQDEIYGERLLVSGMIAACYVVFDGEAVVVNASVQTRHEIMSVIEMLNPDTSSY